MSLIANFSGNLTKDPEMRQVGSSNVCSFSVGVRTNNKNKDGGYDSMFVDVSVWGKRGESIMTHAGKGTQVFVSGELATNEFTGRDGTKRFGLRVSANTVDLLSHLKSADEAATKANTKTTIASIQTEDVGGDDEMPF